MGPLGPVISKLYTSSEENPLLFSENCLFLLLLYMLGTSSIDVSTFIIKIFQTQKRHFMPLSKVSNVKTFCDHGDLENNLLVKFKACTLGKKKQSLYLKKFMTYGHLSILI